MQHRCQLPLNRRHTLNISTSKDFHRLSAVKRPVWAGISGGLWGSEASAWGSPAPPTGAARRYPLRSPEPTCRSRVDRTQARTTDAIRSQRSRASMAYVPKVTRPVILIMEPPLRPIQGAGVFVDVSFPHLEMHP